MTTQKETKSNQRLSLNKETIADLEISTEHQADVLGGQKVPTATRTIDVPTTKQPPTKTDTIILPPTKL